jgi:sialate O-acetylesterase
MGYGFGYGFATPRGPLGGPRIALNALFSAGAVLQRGGEYLVWGTGAPGDELTLACDTSTGTATVGEDGTWSATMSTHAAGGPFDLVVTGAGDETVTVSGCYFGDVYVISGQSNAEMRVDVAIPDELTDADYPEVRSIIVPHVASLTVQSKVPGLPAWDVCSAANAVDWSAIGFVAARELNDLLDVPIGIIQIAWGGTNIDAWSSAETLGLMLDYEDALSALTGPVTQDNITVLWNGMLKPCLKYGHKGVIWYQGENNVNSFYPSRYERLLENFIAAWRTETGKATLPFILIGLANTYPVQTLPIETSTGGGWAWVRESQIKVAAADANVTYVPITDTGDVDGDLHPHAGKLTVGQRVAMAARGLIYGEEIVHEGPSYASSEVVGSELRVTLTNPSTSLTPADPVGWAITDATKTAWYEATASVSGNVVTLTHASVETPAFFRYGWAANPKGNLASSDGWPVLTMRNDPGYGLSVLNGTGDTTEVAAGTVKAVTADAAATGYAFREWEGDISGLADAAVSPGSLTMPAEYVAIKARYNALPVVAITVPAADFTADDTDEVTVSGTVTDADGTIASVTIKNNGTTLGTATLGSGTFTYAWDPGTGDVGSASLTAVAVDNDGDSKTSAAVAGTITGTGDPLAEAEAAIVTAIAPDLFWIAGLQTDEHIAVDGSGNATQLTDISGNANHIVSRASTDDPAYSTIGTDGVVNFDRTNADGVTGELLDIPPAVLSSKTKWSLVLVLKRPDTTHIGQMMAGDTGDMSIQWRSAGLAAAPVSAQPTIRFQPTAGSPYLDAVYTDTSTYHVVQFDFDGTQTDADIPTQNALRAQAYIDGVAATVGFNATIGTTTPALVKLTFGRNTNDTNPASFGLLGCLIKAGAILTSEQVTALHTNLAILLGDY